ncbi:glycosyltransferase family 4 protein, partial [Candidatus Bathyarchaeota archaeon]|nr:glycosyltransferase family 4 protein [Candidatus Bathyarchaeota archaeon]
MNVLYYREPKSPRGGVSNVAYYLIRALEEKVNVTRFPKSMPRGFSDFLGICGKVAKKEFDIVHFNLAPVLINGSHVLLELAKKRDIPAILNIHGI